ncbi:MAG TPA: quinoprotein dehydrogenase-associated SoxYZ-like carrier [Burkholderiales bacterium]|jgi:sulfur-oxidizing protein SoxY|nr:quinoprotein dehydrogenase-associated SoxYZ-like carrier [Burkholderiales bacterium]
MKNGTHWAVGLLASLVFAMPAAANEKAEPDPARSPYWESIRQLMFGDRVINADDRDVIRVYLNLRADDASTVPVAVKSQIDQTEKDYIKSIYLIVERNPSPTAGVFHFTPSSGRAQVETRLRFEDFSFVRAVAEMNDGKLYMSQRWVKAAGGCSAPNAKNFVPEALLGKMKLRFEDDFVSYGKPNLVQLMIRHPNESALAADFDAEKVPQFVRSVKVSFNGRPVMDAEVDFSISDNPNFRFFFNPHDRGELKIEVEDTHDRRFTHSVPIAEGTPLPGG